MKIRTGFVSNSSSTSFIISAPNRPQSIKAKFTVEYELPVSERINTVEKLDKYYIDYYGIDYYGSLEELKNWDDGLHQEYLTAKKEIEAGRIIVIGYLTNEGDDVAIQSILCEEGLEGKLDRKFKIIHTEEGF